MQEEAPNVAITEKKEKQYLRNIIYKKGIFR